MKGLVILLFFSYFTASWESIAWSFMFCSGKMSGLNPDGFTVFLFNVYYKTY